MNKAPLVYTGADVSRFANIPMMGCQKTCQHSVSSFEKHKLQNGGNTYSHNAKHPVTRRAQSVAGASLRRWK